jgi:Domain of unknown function (DUF6265)
MRLFAFALLLLMTPLALRAQAAPASANAPAADIARLSWLTGCWELRTASRVTQESWIAPAGGLMLGTSRTVVREVAREFEFLRIESRAGVATYVAQPNGGTATPFGATAVSDTAVTFENLQHDFPQRIMYRRVGADSLVARIEGPQGGQVRGIDFRMQRIGCGG